MIQETDYGSSLDITESQDSKIPDSEALRSRG